MKQLCGLLAGVLCTFLLNAQRPLITKIIQPYLLGLSCDRTTNIIFPSSIISVDRGSDCILVQKANGAENILQLKADTANFPVTNLSVVTADAKFYSFLLHYISQPSIINLQVLPDSTGAELRLTGLPIGKASFDELQAAVIANDSFISKSASSQKMQLTLRNIFLKDSLLLFGVRIINKSSLDYPVERVRFIVKDRKRANRTSVQEVEYQPLYNTDCPVIAGKQGVDLVFAFCPFTYRDTQQLIIQLIEAHGGRNVSLAVMGKILLRVRKL